MWDELLQLVASVQQHQSAMANVEVKAARGVTPQRLYRPHSAFASHLRTALQVQDPLRLLLVDLDEWYAV
jgi:hypothetical protein